MAHGSWVGVAQETVAGEWVEGPRIEVALPTSDLVRVTVGELEGIVVGGGDVSYTRIMRPVGMLVGVGVVVWEKGRGTRNARRCG